MKDIGKRIDLHMHTLLSDGELLPSELARRAEAMGYEAIAITDHVDSSNIEEVLYGLHKFISEEGKAFKVKIIPGVELTHIPPPYIERLARQARILGARIIVVHGETPSEPVAPGTNEAIAHLRGVVDIMGHPGKKLTENVARLAAENGIYLELTAKKGHSDGNKHVAKMAKKVGAKLIVNTDSHGPEHLLTQKQAIEIAIEAGLLKSEALIAVRDNPRDLVKKVYK